MPDPEPSGPYLDDCGRPRDSARNMLDGMGLADTRMTIAHEIAHLAGATEREARRYEVDRSRGAWWAPTRPKPAEPTAAIGLCTPPACGLVDAGDFWLSRAVARGLMSSSWRLAAAPAAPECWTRGRLGLQGH